MFCLLHTRIINEENLFKKVQSENLNPYFEAESYPLIEREIKAGKDFLLKRNIDLKAWMLDFNIYYNQEDTIIEIGIWSSTDQ